MAGDDGLVGPSWFRRAGARAILRQVTDRGQLGCRGSLLARALDALMLRLETGLFGQGLLPVAFERARHQPVLGSRRHIAGARADLGLCAPAAVANGDERRALGLEVVGERQACLIAAGWSACKTRPETSASSGAAVSD